LENDDISAIFLDQQALPKEKLSFSSVVNGNSFLFQSI
jgi:hypothetical protein